MKIGTNRRGPPAHPNAKNNRFADGCSPQDLKLERCTVSCRVPLYVAPLDARAAAGFFATRGATIRFHVRRQISAAPPTQRVHALPPFAPKPVPATRQFGALRQPPGRWWKHPFRHEPRREELVERVRSFLRQGRRLVDPSAPFAGKGVGHDRDHGHHGVRVGVRRPGCASARADLIPFVVLPVKPLLPRAWRAGN
jgi:hypothetical protein